MFNFSLFEEAIYIRFQMISTTICNCVSIAVIATCQILDIA